MKEHRTTIQDITEFRDVLKATFKEGLEPITAPVMRALGILAEKLHAYVEGKNL